MSVQNKSVDVVFVGAGPVGLWTALQTKIRNPSLNIVVLEKYSEYQRIHSLFIDATSLQTDCHSEDLNRVIHLFQTEKKLSTATIEKELSLLAEKVGIVFERNVNIQDPDRDLFRFPNAKVIVGADGAHSIMREKVVGKSAGDCFSYQSHHQYIADLTYSEKAPPLGLLAKIVTQLMVGDPIQEIHNKEKNETILRAVISQEEYDLLQGATRKNPESLQSDHVKPHLREKYLRFLECKYGEGVAQHVDLSQATITTTRLDAYVSGQFVKKEKERVWCLVGDAAFGVPYFRSLNNGLVSGTELSKVVANFSSKDDFEHYTSFVQTLAAKEAAIAILKSSAVDYFRTSILMGHKLLKVPPFLAPLLVTGSTT
jgi:2-polyprenyl-6-methoxyphenol hydroxylase-like FAD-dependent oxidoreductase